MNLVPYTPTTLNLMDAYLLGFGSPTRKAYKRDLDTYWAFCGGIGIDPLDATRPECAAFVRWMEEVRGYAPATRARKIAAIRGFYEYLVDEDILVKSPAASLKGPKVSQESQTLGLTRQELQILLDGALESDPVDYALVRLLACHGLRVSEAISNFDYSLEQGRYVLHVTRKGGKVAMIPISWETERALYSPLGGINYPSAAMHLCQMTRSTAWRSPAARISSAPGRAAVSGRMSCMTFANASYCPSAAFKVSVTTMDMRSSLFF